MKKNILKVGYLQFAPKFGDRENNLKTVLNLLKPVRADVMVLPELAFTGYYFKNAGEAKASAERPQSSQIVEALRQVCREKKMNIVTGFAELQKDKCFNSALLIGRQGLIHTYRKLHLFYEEKNCFSPGDIPLAVHKIGDAKIGMMICFDWVFPEVSRTLSVLGADVICHPSNLVMNYCQSGMITRSIENLTYFVTANRIGKDVRPHGEMRFTGQSQITAPKGTVLSRAPKNKNAVVVIEIDLDKARDKHLTTLNDLMKDRRPGFY